MQKRAWVSRVEIDHTRRNSRGQPTERRTKMEDGMKGVKANDQFVVEWYDPAGKRRREKVQETGRYGKRLADDRAAEIRDQMRSGTYKTDEPASKAETPWKAFREQYERLHFPSVKESTQGLYRTSLDIFEEICGPKTIGEINRETIDHFRVTLCERPGRKADSKAKMGNVNKHLRHIKIPLRMAYDWEYVDRVPKVVFARMPDVQPIPMATDHFAQIYNALDDVARYPAGRSYSPGQWWKSFMYTLVTTGLRVNCEALAMRWENVFLDPPDFDPHIVVPHGQSKSGREEPVVLPDGPGETVDHLRALEGHSSPLVFDWPGWPDTKDPFYQEWRRIQREAGISIPCSDPDEHRCTETCNVYPPHSTRRTFMNENEERLTPEQARAAARHTTDVVRQKHYLNRRRQLAGVNKRLYVPELKIADVG